MPFPSIHKPLKQIWILHAALLHWSLATTIILSLILLYRGLILRKKLKKRERSWKRLPVSLASLSDNLKILALVSAVRPINQCWHQVVFLNRKQDSICLSCHSLIFVTTFILVWALSSLFNKIIWSYQIRLLFSTSSENSVMRSIK